MSPSRRIFVRIAAAAAAALGALPFVSSRARGQGGRGSPAPGQAPGSAAAQGASRLNVSALLSLAYVVLPAELGAARVERATTAFARWIGSYRAGEETLHPYGSERLGATAPSPVAKWAEQLAALNADSLAAHGAPFSEQSLANRTALVQAALAKVPLGPRMPSPISAPHVAVALLAHFAESAEGVNLAYSRTIDPKQCRPLAASPNIPVQIGRGGRG
ncbi:MAG: hypothetical protein P3A28_07800 [Gemmatimonadota bacterium]|nr:hypothetical protein [Gemmatimonadota bacterium]